MPPADWEICAQWLTAEGGVQADLFEINLICMIN